MFLQTFARRQMAHYLWKMVYCCL